MLFYSRAEMETSPVTYSLRAVHSKSGSVLAAGKETGAFIWLIVLILQIILTSKLVPVLLGIGLLPLKMQQSYLVSSLLSGVFLSPLQNSSYSVNQED